MLRILAALMLFAWTSTAQAETPLRLVASFSVLGDMAREIGGEDVAVETLVGPDGDVHVFQPAPSDARKLAAASLFLVNGLALEGWLDRLEHSSGFAGQVVTVSDGVTALTGDEGAGSACLAGCRQCADLCSQHRGGAGSGGCRPCGCLPRPLRPL